MITDLGHPAFAAHDVDETIGFYGMLGIEEAFRLHHDDGSLMLSKPSLLPAGQIDAEQDHDPADDLIDPQRLAEEHDTRRDPDDGDEVLVDEHPIRPDAANPPARPRTRTQWRRQRSRRLRPRVLLPRFPLQAQHLWGGDGSRKGMPNKTG